MALNFSSNLFPHGNLYSDDGRLLSEADAESAGRERTQVIVSGAQQVGDVTLYTVASGKVLFISSAWMTAIIGDGAAASGNCNIQIDSGVKILGVSVGTTEDPANVFHFRTSNNSLSYPMPVKVSAGEVVYLRTDGDEILCHGGFVGWLEDA